MVKKSTSPVWDESFQACSPLNIVCGVVNLQHFDGGRTEIIALPPRLSFEVKRRGDA